MHLLLSIFSIHVVTASISILKHVLIITIYNGYRTLTRRVLLTERRKLYWTKILNNNKQRCVKDWHANFETQSNALHNIAQLSISGEASPTIWSCYANLRSLSLFISLEIDCFLGL